MHGTWDRRLAEHPTPMRDGQGGPVLARTARPRPDPGSLARRGSRYRPPHRPRTHCTLHTAPSTLHPPHCTLHTARYTTACDITRLPATPVDRSSCSGTRRSDSHRLKPAIVYWQGQYRFASSPSKRYTTPADAPVPHHQQGN
ncbi:hypothetical protein T440DRAFT_528650 [Plenodomus tracheiphilus IPT5]|uniref:Uncharacterized protein n=1 Tax=Plenodomus tracheiphilus IPT5 TaxID=1408161 RepID=A0A6A7B7M7_9PLEO|nr:hypothetical protein T440DRAFT_528650 [Plenodomus tracheiphilus IPT5]